MVAFPSRESLITELTFYNGSVAAIPRMAINLQCVVTDAIYHPETPVTLRLLCIAQLMPGWFERHFVEPTQCGVEHSADVSGNCLHTHSLAR